MAHKTGEHHYEAEVYRLKGALTLQQENQKAKGKNQKAKIEPDPHTEAEACFLQALKIAHAQGAKSLELRAATSLAHLWQHHRKTVDARQMLSECYAWFTEGFNTKGLYEAKGLLATLR